MNIHNYIFAWAIAFFTTTAHCMSSEITLVAQDTKVIVKGTQREEIIESKEFHLPSDFSYFGIVNDITEDLKTSEPISIPLSIRDMSDLMTLIKLIENVEKEPTKTKTEKTKADILNRVIKILRSQPQYKQLKKERIVNLIIAADKVRLQGLPMKVLLIECAQALKEKEITQKDFTNLEQLEAEAKMARLEITEEPIHIVAADIYKKIRKVYKILFNKDVELAGYTAPVYYSIADMLDYKNINIKDDEIDLSDLAINNLEGLQKIPNIEKVEKLTLNNNNIARLNPNCLSGLSALEELVCQNSHIKELIPGCFNGLTKLIILDLSYNEISSLADRTFLQLSNLTILRLENNQISDVGIHAFDGLTHLTHLYMKDNPLKRLLMGLHDALPQLLRAPGITFVTEDGSGTVELP